MSESADLPVARYVLNWGRPGDEGLVALDDANPVGAAWYRLFSRSEPGFGFVDESTPELTIAVVPSRREHGVGHELLEALLERAKAAGHESICLSVEQDSPAVHFYERHGFVPVAVTRNAVTMKRDL